MALTTTVVISTSGQEFPMPGVDWTVDQLKTSLGSVVPGIAGMESTVTTTAEGNKIITFAPRTGTKGALTTTVVISTSGQEFPMPGVDWTVDQLKTSLGSVVPGIAGMESPVTTTAEGNKIITFAPRTGTKG